jgi:hypothetical protein
MLSTSRTVAATVRHGMLLALLACTPWRNVPAQTTTSEFAISNTLLGGISGGIGAVLNRRANESWPRAFGRGLAVGSLGGMLMFEGKNLNHLVTSQQRLEYAWLSRLTYSAGNSIVENAASGRGALSSLHLNVGFVRLDLATAPLRVRSRLLPGELGGTLVQATQGKLDLGRSLKSGTFIFWTRDQIAGLPEAMGFTAAGSVLYSTRQSPRHLNETIAHEIEHTFQSEDYVGVASFLKPLADRAARRSPEFAGLGRWVYPDVSVVLFIADYFLIRGGAGREYCQNFHEREARFLATRRDRCTVPDEFR